MIFWVLTICIVIPIVAVLIFAATHKPAGPPSCAQCQDGQAAVQLPIEARDGMRLALRCPGCGARYAAKISKMSIKSLPEESFQREFGGPAPDAPPDRP